MRFRVYRGGTNKTRKIVPVKYAKEESMVLHLDMTKLWSADLVWTDEEGLEFHWDSILTDSQWLKVKDEWDEVAILSGETLKTLVCEWPNGFNCETEKMEPAERCIVRLEGFPVTVEFDYETAEEIFTDWKLSAVDWDEFQDTLAHVDEDFTDIMNDFRDTIVRNKFADVTDFEDTVYWLDKQFDTISKELEQRVTRLERQWK